MKPHTELLTIAFLICVVCMLGCKTSRKFLDIDTPAHAVSHKLDNSSVVESPSDPSLLEAQGAETNGAKIFEGLNHCKAAVMDTLKATGMIVVGSIVWVVDCMIGSEDVDDSSTPRGQADRDLNQWKDDRDRWMREK